VRGLIAFAVMCLAEQPRIVIKGGGRMKVRKEVVLSPASKIMRAHFKSNKAGVKRGIPIYGLAADGLLQQEDETSKKPCNPMTAHAKPIPYEAGYEYLNGLVEEGKLEEWFKSFGLEGEDLVLFLVSKNLTGSKRKRGINE
jgi:hypothetical protein